MTPRVDPCVMRNAWVSTSSVRRAVEPRRRRDDESGFTLIEVMVATFILIVGVLGSLTLINTANLTSLRTKARTGAVNLARQVQEGARAVENTVPYTEMSNGCPSPSSLANPCPTTSSIVAALRAQPGLAADASSPAGVWQITRGHLTYTVKVAVCSMDDPTDGYGSHASGGPFCSDATAGSTDSQADDYKRVTVDVSWGGTGSTNDARAVALIQSSGVNGPAVSCLAKTGSSCPNAPVITSPSTTSLNFTATISGSAASLEWFVDGEFQGTATPSGGSASFTWSIGTLGSGSQVYDGTYEVSAIAYDANGNAGTEGTVEVQLNREAPHMPGSYTAGRDIEIMGNGTIGGVDLDWLPVPDQDVLYYRVYSRLGSGTPVLEYQTADASQTSYTDQTVAANPNAWGGGGCSNPLPADPNPLYYYVVAVDQNGSTPREGTQTASIDVNGCDHKPKNIGGFSKVVNADGTVTFDWDLPGNPVDPDSGDTLIGYRVYRWAGSGGETIPDERIEYVLGSSTLTWTDVSPQPGGVTQNYCVRGVDTHMQESDKCSGKQTY
jgi:type II secretory pathway pseudopilin PulG